ncbi:S-layer homology domain-containing protein [Paenibacillus sp. 1P07SE]|uniref:S-layer homology domain-containing protein n=1 Tax=Paenibacillus sp. 1P07SE TaxID=3132209 RepID=UPI0039A5EDFD
MGKQDYTREAKDSADDLKAVVELVLEHAMLSGDIDPNIGNQAQGRVVSTNSNHVTGNLYAATDGKADTQVTLNATSQVREPELIVDLVGKFQISKIQVLLENQGFGGYELYLSSDRESWTKVGEIAASEISEEGDTFSVADLEGRYVKLQAVGTAGASRAISIQEFRAYGERILPSLDQLSSLVDFAATIPEEASDPDAVSALRAALQNAEQAIAIEAAVDQVNSVYWNLYESILRMNLLGRKNVAIGKPVTAHNGTSGNPGRLVDNNIGSHWDSGRLSQTGQPYQPTITPGWAIVDLGETYQLDELQVIFGTNNQGHWHHYELHTSLDGTSWTKVGEKTTQTTPNEAEDTHALEHVKARYVRLATTNIREVNNQRAPYQVAELRVMGTKLDAVTEVADAADVYVPYGSTAEQAAAYLPPTVGVTLESGLTVTSAVLWTISADYDGTTPGEYTATGTLSSQVYNPDELTASAKIIVGPRGENDPPVWPEASQLQASNIGRGGLTLTWTAAEDADRVTGYSIYDESGLVGTVAGDVTTYTVTGLTAGTTYTFTVQAVNAFGLWTTDGPAVTVTTERAPSNPQYPIYPVYPEPPVTPPGTDPEEEPGVSHEIVVKAPEAGADGIAKARITRDAYDKAAAEGAQVTITVEEAPQAAGYEVILPPTALAGGSSGQGVTIRTVLGTISAASDLLPPAAVTGVEEVSLSIAKADRGTGVDLAVKVDGKEQAWRSGASLDVFLPYTPTAAALADSDYILVWHTEADGTVRVVASGKYDAERGGVVFMAERSGRYTVDYVHKTFGDLQGYDWARSAIESMASRGIINGTSAETYRPGAEIKRADFIALLVRTLNLKSQTQANFDDVRADAYYAEEVAVAKALGITQGTGDNQFKPEQSISRQEMMVLLDRALALLGQPLEEGSLSDLEPFQDYEAIAGYARQSVANLVKSGLIQGKGDGIDPSGQATRAEIAVLVERLYRFVY